MDDFYLNLTNGHNSINLEDLFSSEEFRKLAEKENTTNNISAEVLVAITFQSLIVFIGIVANLLVIVITVFGNTRQESSSIIYVTNLSISSFVFLCTVPLKLIEDIYLRWKFGLVLCQITTLIKFLNFTVAAFFLMAMSVDRYLAVNKPLTSSHLRSKIAARIASVTLWILSLAGALPLALFHSDNYDSRCSPKFPDENISLPKMLHFKKPDYFVCQYRSASPSFTVWTICNFVYSFLIPFVVIIICYCAIVRRVRNPSGIVNSKGKLQRVVRRKVTQMAIFLVISYAICYIPYYVWQQWRLVGVPVSNLTICNHMERFNITMAYINSTLHPILYACTSGQFSKQYRMVRDKLTRHRRNRKLQNNSLNSAQTRRTIVKNNGTTTTATGEMNDQQRPLVTDVNQGDAPRNSCTSL